LSLEADTLLSCSVLAGFHANLATTWRAAKARDKRATPLKTMLIPTRVPITHSVLDGQLLQIRIANIKVMIPSNSSQFDPGIGRRRNDKANSNAPFTNR
jgi:hypothetical protein